MSTCIKALYTRLNTFSSLLINKPCLVSFREDYYTSSARFDRQYIKVGKRTAEYDYSIIIFHPNRLECLHPDLYKKYRKPNNGSPMYDLLDENKTKATFIDHEQRVMYLLKNADTIGEKPKKPVVLSSTDNSLKPNEPPPLGSNETDSSEKGLNNVFITFSQDLENFFGQTHPYFLYHQDVVFENNIKGTRVVGIGKYAWYVFLAKIYGHIRFAYVKLNILKITKHPEDNTVRVRWRVQGIGGTKVMLTFWRFKFWKLNEQLDAAPTWIDGFSIFYVGSDGLIHKHVVDKMQPDDDKIVNDKSNMAAKLALILGGFIDKEGLLYYLSNLFKTKKKRLPSDSEITVPPAKVHN